MRLVTSGAEFKYAAAILGQSETPGHLSSAAIETTVVRSGAAAWKAAAHSQFASFDVTSVDADSYFARGYFRWAAAPVVLQRLINVLAGSQGQVRTLTGTTQVGLYDDNNALVGSASSALALDTWHRIEMVIGRTATRLELWIDGVQIASTTSAALGASTITQFQFGNSFPTASTDVVYFDDVAINDSTGGVDDGLPGPGKIVLLLPTADYQRDSGWNVAVGGSTNLYDEVNNTPPTADPGVANDIVNGDSTTTQTYTAETATYSSAGITAADRIKIVRGLAVIGDGVAGATRSIGLKLDNNPSDTEVTANTPTGLAQVYPTNWVTMRGTLNTSPSVTLGNPVRIRVRKNSANADTLLVALMGVYVEYVPAVLGSAALSGEGGVTATGVGAKFGAAAVSGEGVTTASGIRNLLGSAALSGESDLLAAATKYAYASAVLSGESDLTAQAVRNLLGSAALSGEGDMSSAAVRALFGSASLAGDSDLTAVAVRTLFGAAILSGDSNLSAAAIRNLLGSAVLSGEGTLFATAAGAILYGAAVLSGEGVLTGSSVRALFAAANLSGQGDLAAAAVRNLLGSAALSGEGVLAAQAIRSLLAAAVLSGEGTLLAAALKLSYAAAVLSGEGTLTAAAMLPVGPPSDNFATRWITPEPGFGEPSIAPEPGFAHVGIRR